MRNDNYKSNQVYQRICKRCECVFYTRARSGQFCEKCYKGNSKVKQKLFEGLDNYSKNKIKCKDGALNRKNKAFCKEVEA